ncbi:MULTISPECIES: three-helix bundle dimerization domain-containing protein [Rhodococcus]|uniref:Uncharacterized protein n=1 Tax=Rhodococcus oxybenzonivorans TaxID=1990687 RepID=A0AAE5A8U9_9NOCA|nr:MULTISPECIES: hypothetical protein [Rhodococcus]MDV7243527.1 hypothetical protein [Rhodococcus oxybenzonivorans]MDV7268147.1 hypothetical protein [Rhodococcus oxybenzonivorans]MDV7277503.1 hypothetical protein [Rhodococcus oxybenzonivorans]MDV7335469.1 hypothetical protein [Rhodococcus oxybenzonivorans]MDV7347215.1 hypothetical protein [Rhodococcus oxybenzonivorans]
MDDTEERDIDVVRTRLIQRFPDLEPGVVEDLVVATLHRFDGCRIRDFVPLLVERAATRTLDATYSRAPMLAEPALTTEVLATSHPDPVARPLTSSGRVRGVFARRSPRLS